MAFGLGDNLRGFAHSRPPIVIFMLCVGGCAVVLVTLAYYVKVKELTNPDITEDWNTFLKNFGDMEFCIAGNSSEYLAMTSPATSAGEGSRSRKMDKVKVTDVTTSQTTVSADWSRGNVSVSVQMAVELQPTYEFLSIPHNVTHLSATVLGSQLGFAGDLGDAELNVTMELPYEWNQTMCRGKTACRGVTILTCVTMYSQAGIFPVTRRPVCNSSLDTGSEKNEYYAQMVSRKTRDDPDHVRCERRPLVRLQHQIDRTLSVMLTMHDRSVINLHLMHTSYFLFVMVITLFCYALIKGRPVRVIQYTDKVPQHA